MRILCIGAHPDDVELSMGGTVLRMKEAGHEIYIADLTDGEPTPFGDPKTRASESRKASEKMGIKDRFRLSMQNRYVFDSVENRKELAGVFRITRPDAVFTHYPYDIHPDHIAASHISEAARFYGKLSKSDISGDPFFCPRLIYYFPNHIRMPIRPSFCVDISKWLQQKEDLLRIYESQFIKNGGGKVISDALLINGYYGLQCGCQSAEPFYMQDTPEASFLGRLTGVTS